MLQSCLNGGRSRQARGGPRQPDKNRGRCGGGKSLAPDDVARCPEKLRRRAPDMPVGVSTGAWIEPHLAARLAQIGAWQIIPTALTARRKM